MVEVGHRTIPVEINSRYNKQRKKRVWGRMKLNGDNHVDGERDNQDFFPQIFLSHLYVGNMGVD